MFAQASARTAFVVVVVAGDTQRTLALNSLRKVVVLPSSSRLLILDSPPCQLSL